jgi:hypothetical protein
MRRTLLAVALVLAALGTASGVLGAAGPSKAQALRITSTLDGKKVLPIRSRWLTHPNVPSAKIARVDFLIDGRVRCIERYAPYNYGSDDFHGHLGWLVTSWLTPGKHRFTARATLSDGRKASDTVVARVLPAPEPPAALAGRWKRTVTKEDIARFSGDIPAGEWELVFDRVGVWALDPGGSGIAEHVVASGRTLAVDAALWMTPTVDGRGKPPLNRYGHTDFGAGFREDGPPARYTWSVTGDELKLAAVHEPTGSRRALWEGTWVRATG